MEKIHLNFTQKIDFLINRLEVIETILEKKESLRVYSKMLSFDYALSYLLKEGFPMSKSKLYKLTSTNAIPCARFGSKLVFDREELIKWCKERTSSERTKENVLMNLSKNANKKSSYEKGR